MIILLGVVYTLFNLEKRVGISRSVYEAIPKTSLLVLDFKEPEEFIQDLERNSLVWDDLVEVAAFEDFSKAVQLADSLLNSEMESFDIFHNNRLMAAGIRNDQNKINWVFYIPVMPGYSDEGVRAGLQNFSPSSESMGFTINGKSFGADVRDGILYFSSNTKLLEQTRAILDSKTGLVQNSAFNVVYQRAGKNKPLNIYLNHAELDNFLKDEGSETGSFESFKKLGVWTELDLSNKPNSVQLDGFSYGISKSFVHFDLAMEELWSVIPKKNGGWTIRSMESIEFSPEVQDAIDSLWRSKQYRFNDGFHASLNGFVCELQYIRSKKLGAANVVLLKPKDTDQTIDHLKQFCDVDSTGDLWFFTPTFTPLAKIYSEEKDTLDVMCFREGWLMLAEDRAILESLIFDLDNERSLSKDAQFQLFTDNLLEPFDYTFYYPVFRSPSSFADGLGSLLGIDRKSKLHERLEGLLWQYSYDDEMDTYHHMYVKYNAHIEEERNTLWEFTMGSNSTMTPQLFINHYSESVELFVQDSKNRVYLINNKGKKLWDKKVDGPILGDISILDKYQNGKLQILFNTPNSVYILDRKGRNLEGFPVKSKAAFSAQHTLMDYDNNGKYRILIPRSDSTLSNYNSDGKEVKGWKAKRKANIECPVQYTRVSSKDYVLLRYEDGSFEALNRKGEIRLKFKYDVPKSYPAAWRVQKGKSPKSTFILIPDSGGTITKLFFNNRRERKSFDLGELHAFSAGQYDDDDQLETAWTSNKGYGYIDQNWRRKQFFSGDSLKSGVIIEPNSGFYGAILSDTVRLYANQQAVEMESVLKSKVRPIILDLHDDGKQEILINSGGVLYCYPLEN